MEALSPLRLADGNVTRTWSTRHSLPQITTDLNADATVPWNPASLAWVADGVVEQTVNGVRRLSNLADVLKETELAAARTPTDTAAAAAHALYLREAGDRGQAIDVLLNIIDDEDPADHDLLVQNVLDASFTESWLLRDASRIDDISLQLIETNANRVRFHLCRVRDALESPSPVIIEEALALLDLGARTLFPDPRRWHRLGSIGSPASGMAPAVSGTGE